MSIAFSVAPTLFCGGIFPCGTGLLSPPPFAQTLSDLSIIHANVERCHKLHTSLTSEQPYLLTAKCCLWVIMIDLQFPSELDMGVSHLQALFQSPYMTHGYMVWKKKEVIFSHVVVFEPK